MWCLGQAPHLLLNALDEAVFVKLELFGTLKASEIFVAQIFSKAYASNIVL